MDTVDVKIAAAEARTDTKFAELRGDLHAQFGELKAELAKKPGTGTTIATAIAVVAVILAVLALSANRFDAGMSVRAAVQDTLTQQDAQQAKRDAELVAHFDRLADQQHRAAENSK